MKHSVEYYLANGFDKKAAEYFASGKRKLVSVAANDDYTLTLGFDNGKTRVYDAAPLIRKGTVFAFLSDIENFRRVYLDEQHSVAWDIDPNVDSNLVWNNKVDLCPDSCYLDSVPVESAIGA